MQTSFQSIEEGAPLMAKNEQVVENKPKPQYMGKILSLLVLAVVSFAAYTAGAKSVAAPATAYWATGTATGTVPPPAGVAPVFAGSPGTATGAVAPPVAPVFTGAPVAPVFAGSPDNTYPVPTYTATGTVAPPVAPVFTGAPVAPVYASATDNTYPVPTYTATGTVAPPVAPVYAPATDSTYPVPTYTEPLAADPAGALAPPAYPATASLRRN
jgi:hypothetical protein